MLGTGGKERENGELLSNGYSFTDERSYAFGWNPRMEVAMAASKNAIGPTELNASKGSWQISRSVSFTSIKKTGQEIGKTNKTTTKATKWHKQAG